MCKGCWSDPGWDEIRYKRQGAVEVSDFDDEIKYRKPGKGYAYGRNRKRTKSDRGCPANEGKAHVWVWTSEREPTDIFFKHFGFHKKVSKVCAGCYAVSKTRESDEYMRRKERAWRKLTGGEFDVNRGEPVQRYRWRGMRFWSFRWEDYDPIYKAKYDAWLNEQREIWLRRTEWTPYPRY